jgi:energy-coupling factor transporter ATP-binding protein EcfA2
MIRIRDLTYHYPQTAEPALQNINLEIPAGQFCGIAGANEAGKSTLCYAITGFIPHHYRGRVAGSVEVAGYNIEETPLGELTGQIGFVFQNSFNQISGARFSVREEIAFGLENLGVPRKEMIARVEQALELTGLEEEAERSPFALSGGQQQRLALASILVMQPKALVLDEPTSQLDPAGTREVFATLETLTQESKTTVVLVEHKLEWLATFADRIVLLDDGRVLADGAPQQVLASSEAEEAGLNVSNYTKAARSAIERGFAQKAERLPVTFDQAVRFFQ